MKKMKKTSFAKVAILLLVAIYMFIGCTNGGNPIVQSHSNLSVYDRVVKDSVIRCGYTIYPPGCMKDSSGKLSGVFVETLEKAASDLGFKVQWVEEVGWETQIQGLENDRYDMMGSSVWSNPKRAKLTTLSVPLYFSPICIYVRSDDNRFVGVTDWSMLNNSRFKISVVDGGTGDVIRKSRFPEATSVALPENTDFGTSFLDVVNNKADLLFLEPYQASKFIQSNGYKVKNVSVSHPLYTFGNCYMFKRNQSEFEHMLNAEVENLINNGYVDDLLSKYEIFPNSFLRVQKSYVIK
ncbi:MAG: transporter substrate-binding domain-containing protein [Chitinophagaceae bacterium]|nr:transporter substrate-binding domain-containing protein [Chitinophagaceae bacterium]